MPELRTDSPQGPTEPTPIWPAPTVGPSFAPFFSPSTDSPRLFERAATAIVTSDDFPDRGPSVGDLTAAEANRLIGFAPLEPSTLPAGYGLDELQVFPDTSSVRQCFRSPSGSHATSLCITQQPQPFSDPIGPSTRVHVTEAPLSYGEFVYGGWLGLSTGLSTERTYQWDEQIVPVLTLRYMSGNVHTELSAICAGHEACLEIGDLFAIVQSDPSAQSPGSPWGSAELIDWFQYSGVPAGASHLIPLDELSQLPVLPNQAHQFDITIWGVCMPCRGRVYAFASNQAAGEAFRYLYSLAATGTTAFGRVYSRDNLVVLIDQGVPDDWARGYEDALRLLGE